MSKKIGYKGQLGWVVVLAIDSCLKDQATSQKENNVLCCYYMNHEKIEKKWVLFEQHIEPELPILKVGIEEVVRLKIKGGYDTSLKFISVNTGECLKVLKFVQDITFENLFQVFYVKQKRMIAKEFGYDKRLVVKKKDNTNCDMIVMSVENSSDPFLGSIIADLKGMPKSGNKGKGVKGCVVNVDLR